MISTILVRFRLISWGLGMVLSFVSRLFENENAFWRTLSTWYFAVSVLSAFIPAATIALIIDSSRKPYRAGRNFLKELAMAGMLVLYISADIALFHGGV